MFYESGKLDPIKEWGIACPLHWLIDKSRVPGLLISSSTEFYLYVLFFSFFFLPFLLFCSFLFSFIPHSLISSTRESGSVPLTLNLHKLCTLLSEAKMKQLESPVIFISQCIFDITKSLDNRPSYLNSINNGPLLLTFNIHIHVLNEKFNVNQICHSSRGRRIQLPRRMVESGLEEQMLHTG